MDPGDCDNPCPAAVAAATISICKNGSYRCGDASVKLDLARLARAGQIVRTVAPTTADAKPCPESMEHVSQITMFQGGAFEAAKWFQTLNVDKDAVPLVLDFASDSEPGGGWKGKQRGTQEEGLCRQSNLGCCLEAHSAVTGAAYMPQNTFVYVPDVVVFRSPEQQHYRLLEEPFWISVVAGALRSTDDRGIAEKVNGVFQVARDHGHRQIVLGAWGCGAFGNDAAVVAKAIATKAKTEGVYLDHVILAMPRQDERFDAFLSVFGDSSIIRSQAPQVDTASAKWSLLGALHCDSMALASVRVAVECEDLRTAEGARRAAQVWLRELISVCLEELAESFPTSLIARLQELLNVDGDAESIGPSTSERRMCEEFLHAAKAVVQDHFRTEKRNLPTT